MKHVLVAAIFALLPTVTAAQTEQQTPRPLGGIAVTGEQLKQMHRLPYVLHTRDGKVQKVPAEKTALPVDPEGHVQICHIFVGSDNAIYAVQRTVLTHPAVGREARQTSACGAKRSGSRARESRVDRCGGTQVLMRSGTHKEV